MSNSLILPRYRFPAGCISVVLLFCAGPLHSSELTIPQFENVTESAGIRFVHLSGEKISKRYLFEAKGGGAGFFDFDNDGWMDILFAQGSTVERFKADRNPSPALYRNLGNGSFEDVSVNSGLLHAAWGMGVAFGDYDNDGFVDVYLTCLKGNALYRNNGNGSFADVTAEAGVRGSGWSSSAAFGDYNQDGFLDLFVCHYIDVDPERPPEPGSLPECHYRGHRGICGPLGLRGAPNQLFRNNGDGTFSDVSREAGVLSETPYFSLSAVWGDLDNDHDLDLFVANDSTPNQLFVNQGDGSFQEQALLSGVAADANGRFQASMGIDLADYNNDGLLDIFSTHFANDYSTLYRNLGNLLFEDVTNEAQILQPEWLLVSWGTRFVDLNHDGWKDLVHSNGHVYPFLIDSDWTERYYQPTTLFLNRKDGTFLNASERAGKDLRQPIVGRGMAFADFDNDGDVDFLITDLGSQPLLLRNNLEGGHPWVMFKTRGQRSNRDGFGARISIVTGGLRQVWEVKSAVGLFAGSAPRAHFGLGQASQVDLVEIYWPSGKRQEFRNLPANSHYLIDEENGIDKEFPDR